MVPDPRVSRAARCAKCSARSTAPAVCASGVVTGNLLLVTTRTNPRASKACASLAQVTGASDGLLTHRQ